MARKIFLLFITTILLVGLVSCVLGFESTTNESLSVISNVEYGKFLTIAKGISNKCPSGVSTYEASFNNCPLKLGDAGKTYITGSIKIEMSEDETSGVKISGTVNNLKISGIFAENFSGEIDASFTANPGEKNMDLVDPSNTISELSATMNDVELEGELYTAFHDLILKEVVLTTVYDVTITTNYYHSKLTIESSQSEPFKIQVGSETEEVYECTYGSMVAILQNYNETANTKSTLSNINQIIEVKAIIDGEDYYAKAENGNIQIGDKKYISLNNEPVASILGD